MDHQKALETYIAAINTHDFANVEKVLDDNAIFWFSDQTCVTREEIRNYFENAWKQVEDEVYGALDVQWIAVDEYTATCIYTFTWEGYSNNQFVSGSGRATNVFVRDRDGVWKLKHEHLSTIK